MFMFSISLLLMKDDMPSPTLWGLVTSISMNSSPLSSSLFASS